MAVWAIADLHLSFGVPDKAMDPFGPQWIAHADKIAERWHGLIAPTDLVLIPGDISWAMHPAEAAADLQWIDKLPGSKLLIRGNHDYWWSSLKKVAAVLPPSIQLIQNNAVVWEDIAIGGARLWDTPEYQFGPYIEYRDNPRANKLQEVDSSPVEAQKVFDRELQRLESSLKALDSRCATRIAMTHYPPIGAELELSRAAQLLEKYRVDICVFGHLHNVYPGALPFGTARGVTYRLTSCDYIDFAPVKLC
jgi:hypothetical protein